jgi:DNA-binding NarL/FixJ family response regulator
MSPEPDAPISVLVVDDVAAVRDGILMGLAGAPGFVAWGAAGSGPDALAQLDRDPPPARPDAVLVDVRMPGMTGIELVARLTALYPGLPCVMLSAHPASYYAERARAAGARGYVEKGRLAEALEAVRRAVAGPGWVTGG